MSRTQILFVRRTVSLAVLLVALLGSSFSATANDDPWPSIKKELFAERAILDAGDRLQLLAPSQADDAALVPVSVTFSSALVPQLKTMTLLIDRNPAPVAAVFEFGDAFRDDDGLGSKRFATRVRVDAFSRVRAVVETLSGALYMTSKFVIGSGGCSAPAAKDSESAARDLGKGRLTIIPAIEGQSHRTDAVVMIKHPNYTGLQMDPRTGNYTPAHFVDEIEVKQKGRVLWKMVGGISISENPNLRFTIAPSEAPSLSFTAKDTEGAVFRATATPAKVATQDGK